MRLAVNEDNCSGCRVCEVVCSLQCFGENNPKKASVRIKGEFPDPGKYRIIYCIQCGVCAEVCPVDAIEETEDGYYEVDEDTCISCMVCVEECPQDSMFTHKSREAPFKCILCGMCIEYCPRNAIYDADDPERTEYKEFKEVK